MLRQNAGLVLTAPDQTFPAGIGPGRDTKAQRLRKLRGQTAQLQGRGGKANFVNFSSGGNSGLCSRLLRDGIAKKIFLHAGYSAMGMAQEPATTLRCPQFA